MRFTDYTLTCVEALEAQHRVVEDQQVGEPHGGAQVVEKVSHRVAEPLRGGQRPPRGRHDASGTNDGTTGENLASRSVKKVEKRWRTERVSTRSNGFGSSQSRCPVPLLAVLERTSDVSALVAVAAVLNAIPARSTTCCLSSRFQFPPL